MCFFRTFIGRLLGIVLLVTTAGAQLAASGNDETATRDRRYRQLHDRRAEVLQRLSVRLTEISEWCTARQLDQAVAETRRLQEQLLHLESLPEPAAAVQPELPEPVTDEQSWQSQLRTAQKDSAGELYTLARSSLRAGFPSLAFAIIGDVVRLDPDHKFARGVLGYQLFMDPERRDEVGYWECWAGICIEIADLWCLMIDGECGVGMVLDKLQWCVLGIGQEFLGEAFDVGGIGEASAGEFSPAGGFDDSSAVYAGIDECDCVGGL